MITEDLIVQIAQLERGIAAVETRERVLAARGWRDDFLGDALADQYDVQIAGAASTVALLNGQHGGVVRCTADIANGNYGVIILGNIAGGYNTLDADFSWTMIWRMRANQLTNIQATAGVYGWGALPFTYAGFRSDISATNWMIRSTADGIAFTNLDTGVAADMGWHVHRLEASQEAGTRRVCYWLDGALLGQITTDISGNLMEATLFCVNRGGSVAVKTTDFDHWEVIPGNLL